MMSLLIVDDEVRIADSLYAMIQETFQERLAVRRCYSAAEAQTLMERTPINILLTDINMPHTSGLELHRWVSGRWPMTRVIYLTGYSDFEYVREALDHHAQGYLLKSDGDDRIIAAIEKAMASVDEEGERLMEKAQAAQARPIFLRQLARRLVYARVDDLESVQADLDRWNLGLDTGRPVLMAHGYFEASKLSTGTCEAMIEALTAGYACRLVAEVSPRRLLVLCQGDDDADVDELSGLMEEAQRIIESQGERMTVALLDCPVPWKMLAAADIQLLEGVHAACPGPGELLRLKWQPRAKDFEIPDGGSEWADVLECIHNLHDCLLTGQREAYFEEEARLTAIGRQRYTPRLFMLMYSSVVMNLRSAASGPDIPKILDQAEYDPAMGTEHEMWMKLHAAADQIFDQRGDQVNSRMAALMREVNAYIHSHLSEELSLTALADMVHFHPVYLSRTYKEIMGMSLSDTIAEARMELARNLLKNSRMNISEISKAAGFSSANYFARWFRKRSGLSPQEYREQLLR